jgi:hypothetical protein
MRHNANDIKDPMPFPDEESRANLIHQKTIYIRING